MPFDKVSWVRARSIIIRRNWGDTRVNIAKDLGISPPRVMQIEWQWHNRKKSAREHWLLCCPDDELDEVQMLARALVTYGGRAPGAMRLLLK